MYNKDKEEHETGYAGIVNVRHIWDRLGLNKLFLSAGIKKRSGIPATIIAFFYVIMPLIDATSVTKLLKKTRKDSFLKKLAERLAIGKLKVYTVTRFLAGKWEWDKFNRLRVEALQKMDVTRAMKNGLLIIDSSILRKFGKKMNKIKWIWCYVTKRHVLGYNLIALIYACARIEYPIDFRLMAKRKNRKRTTIDLAVRLLVIAKKELKLQTKYVAFDAFFFKKKLIDAARALGMIWITKSGSNRKFIVNGIVMHASDIIEKWIMETIAELPNYGTVKLVMVKKKGKWILLVTNGTKLSRKRVIKLYEKRWTVENPFFRDGKQHFGLEGFHTRGYRSLKSHIYLCFVSYTIIAMARAVYRRISTKSNGEIKELYVQVKAKVKIVAQVVTVITNLKRPWIVPLGSAPPP